MKRSNANSKNKGSLGQLKLNFQPQTLDSVIHAIAVKQDTGMTRVYSVVQPMQLLEQDVLID